MGTVESADGALGETLAAFEEAGVPLTTREVAETVSCSRRATYDRLERLVERGAIETKKVGARGRVWWRPPDGSASTAGGGSDDRDATGPPSGTADQFVPAALDTADVATVVLDEEFEVAWANETVERYFGVDRDDLVGRDKRAVVRETVAEVVADGDRFAERVLSTYESGHGAETFECRVTEGPGREERWLEHRSAPLDSGRFAGGRVEVYYDVTDRKDSEHALQTERDRIERVVETSPIAVAVFAADGSTVTANADAAGLLGVAAEEVEDYELGQTELRDESGAVVPYEERPIASVFETGEPVSGVELQSTGTDGEPQWMSVDATPLTDDAGRVTHVVATGADVTGLKEQSRRLERQRDELERQRDELESELDEVLERVTDAVYALDDEFRFTYVNDRAEVVFAHDASELLGRNIWEVFPETEPRVRELFEQAMDTQEPVQLETQYEPAGVWVEVAAYPSESGLSVYFRDVTERKVRQDELEQYRTIVETVDDGIYVLDDEYHFVEVNEAYCELTGYDREELLGSHCSLVVDDEVSESAAALSEELLDGGRDSETIEAELARADGGTVTAESRFTPLPSDDGSYRGTVGVVRDVSERKERERELERYETVVETVRDGIYAHDPEGRFTMVNEAFCEMTGHDREEILGAHSTLVHDEAVDEAARDVANAVVSGGRDGNGADEGSGEGATARDGGPALEFDLQRRDGDAIPVESRFAPYEYEGETAFTGVVRDVSERKQFEATLTALHDTSRQLFDAETATEVSEVVVEAATEVIDLAGVAVYRHDEATGMLHPAAASLVEPAVVDELPTFPLDDDSITGQVFSSGQPRQFENLRDSPDLYEEAGDVPIRGAHFVPLGNHGVFLAGSREADRFDDRTRQLVELLAANATAAYERVDREQQLRRRRDRLRALDDLNAVVRGINEALVEQSSRAEVAQVVCERLAASDSYEFAWFGDVNPKEGVVESEVEVGVDDYLPEIPVSTDPDDDVFAGPIDRAIRTHEVQVVDDALSDPAFGPWREYAREYGYRSAAVVPVVHEGTLYGLVGVYAEQPDAFGGEQRVAIAQLRTVVGHAIASIERKRALMSDEVVEVEFRIPDVFDVVGAERTPDVRIRFDHAVPAGDGRYLVYGRCEAGDGTDGDEGDGDASDAVPEDPIDGVRALVDNQAHWKRLSVLGRGREGVAFEVCMEEPPVVSLVAARGGYLEGATVEDGDYHTTLHLPPGGGARQVVEAVEEAYPDSELLLRRQVTRSDESTAHPGRVLAERLTDRQQAALDAAYYSGYFEWPRDSSGEDVAESLGVSGPTFHQHVRHAQRKLLEVLYEGA